MYLSTGKSEQKVRANHIQFGDKCLLEMNCGTLLTMCVSHRDSSTWLVPLRTDGEILVWQPHVIVRHVPLYPEKKHHLSKDVVVDGSAMTFPFCST